MSEQFEQLKQAVAQANTPEARKAAAEALRRYLEANQGHQSKPTLVSLGLNSGFPNAIPLDKMADVMESNPAFYDKMQKVLK